VHPGPTLPHCKDGVAWKLSEPTELLSCIMERETLSLAHKFDTTCVLSVKCCSWHCEKAIIPQKGGGPIRLET